MLEMACLASSLVKSAEGKLCDKSLGAAKHELGKSHRGCFLVGVPHGTSDRFAMLAEAVLDKDQPAHIWCQNHISQQYAETWVCYTAKYTES